MKTVLVLAALLTSGAAHARFDSLKHSCEAAQARVQSRGATIIHSGRHIYDRYVSRVGYCAQGQSIKPAWIPTADASHCWVGYTCCDMGDGGGSCN